MPLMDLGDWTQRGKNLSVTGNLNRNIQLKSEENKGWGEKRTRIKYQKTAGQPQKV